MSDVPTSPRKTISSVSANARSQQPQKKPGAPKPKGAVRAKSGCYTCRIRRKKCDEQPNGEGACQTCVRLRLQCLGFGAKRPDWMRENNSVTELREKIKTFLASQGMIKGHSGSGPRSNESDPPILVLVENLQASPPAATPPTPTLSAATHEPVRQQQSMTSYVRDPRDPAPYHQPPLPPSDSQQHSYAPQSQQQQTSIYAPALPPPVQSSFSPLYTANGYGSDEELQQSPDPNYEALTQPMNSYDTMIPYEQKELVQHYMSNVLPIQYLLSDQSTIRNFIYELIRSSQSAREAACMLAAIHRDRTTRYSSSLAHYMYKRLFATLAQKSQFTEGDAMAGLHAISTILFSGGRGAWESFLQVASQYVYGVLTNSRFYGPEDVMKHCTESTRFIVKTTMWFDVLASVTTQSVPRFLETYRTLFDVGAHAYIDERSPPETSMLPVMGCENNVVLAIAEISNLAYWKEVQRRRNALSVPKLVERGLEIERKYINPGVESPTLIRGGFPAAHVGVELRRTLTNDIFRASARLYLHTVLSGDYPSCPEIVESVTEVIECLRRIPLDRALVSRSVLRSVVFGICIAGCLTDNPAQREFLMRLLDTQQGEGVGNVAEVKGLMQQVWLRRSHKQGQQVNWREVMRESQSEMLLLV
ncbi:hypothetical protein BDW22DRAFT_1329876 [Trametopsis cervina]|nr:hypothetical protein BDW22DRAFT_1329876 [Trametopsis cervina]